MNRLLGRLRVLGAVAGVLVALLLGGVFGVALGERASQPDVQELVLGDPALAADGGAALRSPGGFTGFEGRPALAGRVLRVGEIGDVTDDRLQVTGDGATAEISLRDHSRLFRLAPLDGSLADGDLVLVRFEGEVVAGVLRLPADLEADAPPDPSE